MVVIDKFSSSDPLALVKDNRRCGQGLRWLGSFGCACMFSYCFLLVTMFDSILIGFFSCRKSPMLVANLSIKIPSCPL
jgi:hypothetical protein